MISINPLNFEGVEQFTILLIKWLHQPILIIVKQSNYIQI